MSVRQSFSLMFDETADSFSPAPNIGDIEANLFGPKVLGKDAPSGGSRWLVREHGCSLDHSISKDGLDVVG
jgi:hypothetical protein